jgi:hypothetical protein
MPQVPKAPNFTISANGQGLQRPFGHADPNV